MQEAPFLRVDIYNNIVYTPDAVCMMAFMTDTEFGSEYDEANDVYNNVFYANDGASVTDGRVSKYMSFTGNLYYNFNFGWSESIKLSQMDAQRKTDDPKFVNVGTGEDGLLTLGGYALQSDSPCIEMGFQLPVE